LRIAGASSLSVFGVLV